MSSPAGLPSTPRDSMSDLSGPLSHSKPVNAELVQQNTENVTPKQKVAEILAEPPKVGKQDDDLALHQDRIDAIDAHLLRVCDAVQKVFSHIGQSMQREGLLKESPKFNAAMENFVQKIDKARSQAAHGEFASAEKTCDEAWNEIELAYKDLEKEFFASCDEKSIDVVVIKGFFAEAKRAIGDSIDLAIEYCKDCSSYLSELNKAANIELQPLDKPLIEAAFKELHDARVQLQEILDGKRNEDADLVKEKIRKATSKCQVLCWASGNAIIARKQMITKAQMAASLIPRATAEKIVTIATQGVGSVERPATVHLNGRQYEVAHDLVKGGYQIIHLPSEEVVLGKGQWNIVVRVCNVSNKSFQALRKPLTPPGAPPPAEEHIQRSIQIYREISKLRGTTVGPEALIRRGTGGVLTSLYSDDVIKWLRMIPPPELRWGSFKSTLGSFIEFAKGGNVHGDIHPGNLSVVYDKGASVPAAPGIIKIEDLDGACHIIEGYDDANNPIYSQKAVDVGIVCKYATQPEVDAWIRCIDKKDLEGIAEVRFGQDILAIGITLYQILTLDFDVDNLYLHKECSPFTDMDGKVVDGKFEEGIFRGGIPNRAAIRLALEEYTFLTDEQKNKIEEFIVLAMTQNTKERAKLQDLEAAMNI